MRRLTLLILTCALFACNNKQSKQASTEAKIDQSQEETKEIVEIKVSAIGESMAEIAFEPKNITIQANSRIRLVLENKSSAEGMLHNFVLVELGSGAEISSAGIKAGAKNQFVPKDKRVIANTAVCKMGETVTVEFDAPAKGSYHYICTYPGHINMIGRLNVN